jgi:23S rRNA pseudouridine1911/1915/1917 synthase
VAAWEHIEYSGTSGERADAAVVAILRQQPGLAELSRTRVHELIEQGGVQLNGDELRQPHRKLRPGMQLAIDLELLGQLVRPVGAVMTPIEVPLRFIYVDDYLAVVEKPAGMSVHPGAGEQGPTLAQALLFHFGQLSDAGGADRPGIVHRLDKETSGLLVVARDNLTHAALARQFAERTTEKLYAALCLEAPEPPAGQIDLPIERSPRDRKLMWCGPQGRPGAPRLATGRSAMTEYRLTEWWGPLALLDVAIHTGRTHQIRVHLQALRVSILCDEKYGEGRNRAFRNFLKGRVSPQWQALWRDCWPEPQQRQAVLAVLAGYPGIFLHARSLAFSHPATGERMQWESPLPPVWHSLRELCPDQLDGPQPVSYPG